MAEVGIIRCLIVASCRLPVTGCRARGAGGDVFTVKEAMRVLEILVLGVVQGVTEFLPVSSSAHLVAARALLGIADAGGGSFDALLHLGTLLAVLVYFRRQWWEMTRGGQTLALMLAAATVPAAAAGWLARAAVDTWQTPGAVGAGLLATSVVLVLGELFIRRASAAEQPSWRGALWVGLAQAAAVLPGVSRSGVTIAAGLVSGMSRRGAVVFSFLLSAPITAGAVAANLPALLSGEVAVGEAGLGVAVSFAVGMVSIGLLLRLIERVGLLPFAVYVAGVGVVMLIAL